MKQPHDSQIAWQLLTRNLDKLSFLTADKGYDWELLRHKLRSEGVKPVIRHREFGWHGVANNVLLDDTTYHQRSNTESAFFALRRKYGDRVSENVVRSIPRTRPEVCRQKRRTSARRR